MSCIQTERMTLSLAETDDFMHNSLLFVSLIIEVYEGPRISDKQSFLIAIKFKVM